MYTRKHIENINLHKPYHVHPMGLMSKLCLFSVLSLSKWIDYYEFEEHQAENSFTVSKNCALFSLNSYPINHAEYNLFYQPGLIPIRSLD